jgi:hypothetical protein
MKLPPKRGAEPGTTVLESGSVRASFDGAPGSAGVAVDESENPLVRTAVPVAWAVPAGQFVG